ncbi:MAG: hypothetical protein ABIH38_03455 [Patescibacteria group bacterium]
MLKIAMVCEKNPEARKRLAQLLEKHHYLILECPDHQTGLCGLTLAPDLIIMHLEPEDLIPCSLVDRLRELLCVLGESRRIFASFQPESCWQKIRALALPCDGMICLSDIIAEAA